MVTHGAARQHHVLMENAARRQEAYQFDIKDAYLTADLDVDLYVTAPPHFYKPGTVWKLHKGLQGLKQSTSSSQ